MDVLLGLLSLAGLSLFLSRLTGRSASLMPLVSVALCMLWFTLWGVAGLLPVGGWVWYAGCLAALAYVLWREKAALLRRLTPGLLLFVAGGVFFVALLSATKPLLTQWDEFTVWGTAAKATVTQNELFSTAESNLFARFSPPGLLVFNYAMQFFGVWAEYKYIAALCILYLAAFAAGGAMLDKRPAAAVVLLAGLVLLPAFFEVEAAEGYMSRAWLTGYADPSLAALFGGGLALYYGSEKKDAWLIAMLGLVAAALTNTKDVGLAFGMLLVLVVAFDLLLVERRSLSFFRIKGVPGWLVSCLALALCVVAVYQAWAMHLGSALEVDRGNVGAGDETLSQFSMLLAGVLALFGVNRTEQFTHVLGEMLLALANRPVSLLGSGLRVLAVIVVLLAFGWLLASTKTARRRVLVFAVSSTLGFVLFYVFNIFTYSYIFAWVEASVLKDYARYISPYWQGWLMASMVLLAGMAAQRAAAGTRAAAKAEWRGQLARVTSVCVTGALLLTVALRGNWNANVLAVSPSLYTFRWDIQNTVAEAEAEGMSAGDVVYLVSQYDNGTRFYMLAYELDAELVKLYAGAEVDDAGETVLKDRVDSQLILPDTPGGRESAVLATPELLATYFTARDVTHVLLDELDDVFYEGFGDLFADGLSGWLEDGSYNGGARYYAVNWLDEAGGRFTLVPTAGEVAGDG